MAWKKVSLMILIFLFIIYFIFILWLSQGIKNISADALNQTKSPFLSIIIAVKNEEKNLNILIESLYNQSLPKDLFEIIIINDESEDNTPDILDNYRNKISNLKFYNSTKPPKKWDRKMWALSQGIELAKGDIILHTDGDCMVEKKWAEKILERFTNPNIGVVISKTPLIGKNLWGKILEIENYAQDIFGALGIGHNLFFTCNGRSLAYRKKYFDDVGGFDKISNIIGGDDDLLVHKIINKKHCKISYVADDLTAVYSKCPHDIKEFVRQRFRYASKIRSFYKLNFVSKELKLIMPFLFLINFFTCYAIIYLGYTVNMILFLCVFIKFVSDYLLFYFSKIKLSPKINFVHYIFLSLFHPFYIVIFSLLGPFISVKWKNM